MITQSFLATRSSSPARSSSAASTTWPAARSRKPADGRAYARAIAELNIVWDALALGHDVVRQPPAPPGCPASPRPSRSPAGRLCSPAACGRSTASRCRSSKPGGAAAEAFRQPRRGAAAQVDAGTEMFTGILRQLRELTEDHAAASSSEGFTPFLRHAAPGTRRRLRRRDCPAPAPAPVPRRRAGQRPARRGKPGHRPRAGPSARGCLRGYAGDDRGSPLITSRSDVPHGHGEKPACDPGEGPL